MPVDPQVHAFRRDLADIALAGQVFAQHYAVPMTFHVVRNATVRELPRGDAAVVVELAAGDTFHVLDLGRDWAWGHGDVPRSVGYVAADSLMRA